VLSSECIVLQFGLPAILPRRSLIHFPAHLVSERGNGSGVTLIDELPTQARCEEYLREVSDTGSVMDVSHVTETWERRLLFAARTVTRSGAQASRLVGMKPRHFNVKMEKWEGAAPSDTKDTS
jgi:hypothetical protein